jgi:hypothetical protein
VDNGDNGMARDVYRSIQTCIDMCWGACMAFNYYAADGLCERFYSSGEIVDDPGVQFGVME